MGGVEGLKKEAEKGGRRKIKVKIYHDLPKLTIVKHYLKFMSFLIVNCR